MMDSADKESFIIIGKIAGVHGVQGWVKVISHTRPRENIKKYRAWQIRPNKKTAWKNMPVLELKPQGKGLVAKLEGIADRTEAEVFKGWEIAIHEQQLPRLQKNEYYWRELVGLRVINHEEQDFGVVDYIIETGANDVLVVKNKEAERLIPYVHDQYIKSIDLDAGEMRVEWDADF